MIDLQEINAEIKRLEHSETTYSNCEKLSVLYTVKKNIDKPKEVLHSFANKSEFAEIAEQLSLQELIEVLDEHMQAVSVLHPKEYRSVLRKLNERVN